ncbi:hypothetical protein A9Q90_09250 [Gammaproteobacteria bacterium 54_18_T64]|nr:hypothetical protein A9Q90_09250 [Gammaproteobacteria bacterium 54_18_T64]
MDGLQQKDKRKGQAPIPKNLKDFLSADQRMSLNSLSHFGWEVLFIRRPAFKDPVVVLLNSDGHSIGILDEDGKIQVDTNIVIRN